MSSNERQLSARRLTTYLHLKTEVGLYGGTRHSSAIALRKRHSAEKIKRGIMHTSNKAFERYFRMKGADLRNIYASATPEKKAATTLQPKIANPKKKES